MSRFFQSLDEEKQEMKKKTTEIVERVQEKLSKREQKLKELSSKVDEVRNAGKNFEKLFKKLMNEIKKYVPYFETNDIPQFLHDLFNDERIKASKPMSSAAAVFLSQFAAQDENKAAQDNASVLDERERHASKKANDLDAILKIESDDEKERELCSYLEQCSDPNFQSEASIALFSVYSRMKDAGKMIDVLKSMDLSASNAYVKNIRDKIDIYLGKIFDLLGDASGDEISEKYISFLISLEESNSQVDSSVIQGRILEFEFLKRHACPENDHPVFRLLYLTRNKLWSEALLHYNSNFHAFETPGGNGSPKAVSTILTLSEFSRLAVENNEFELALKIYSKCNEGGRLDFRLEIYALCVILNEKLIGHPCFEDFIELFKKFDANYLCLPSKDPFVEICRAFYYLNILDFVEAASIIENSTGFHALSKLEESAMLLYSKRYAHQH